MIWEIQLDFFLNADVTETLRVLWRSLGLKLRERQSLMNERVSSFLHQIDKVTHSTSFFFFCKARQKKKT